MFGAGVVSVSTGYHHAAAAAADTPASATDPVHLGSPSHGSPGWGPAEAEDGAVAAATPLPAGHAPPPLPPRPLADSSSLASGGGRSNVSGAFNSSGSNRAHAGDGGGDAAGPAFAPLALHPAAAAAACSEYEVNAAPAMDSELDVRLGSPVREEGDPYPFPGAYGSVIGNGNDDTSGLAGGGRGGGVTFLEAADFHPGATGTPPAPEGVGVGVGVGQEVGGGGGGDGKNTRGGFGGVFSQRSRSADGGGKSRGRATAGSRDGSRRTRSEEVPHPGPLQGPPLAPTMPHDLLAAPPPADAGADQAPTSWLGQQQAGGETGASDRDDGDTVGGRGGESLPSSRRGSSSSMFGSSGGSVSRRRLDAVLDAAKRISAAAQNSSVAGVPEVAMLVETLVTLSADSRDNSANFDTSLNLCENLGRVLDQAESLLEKDPGSAAGRALLEGVQVEAQNVVEVIQAYQRKQRWKQIWKASIYRKRVEEAEAAVARMLTFVHAALQGQSLAEIRDLGDKMARLEGDVTRDLAARRRRREEELIQEEAIPSNKVEMQSDLLIGSGGAGEVYMATYAGVNAAAKVVKIRGEGHEAEQQRKSFLTEVRNMRRLNKSPRVVRVYGIVTSPSEHVLVMEYMSGGDLFSFIKKHRDDGLPEFPEELTRNLINDVAHGLAYLHQHDTWHGDLKSLNILLDAEKRAKISDFGTSHWTAETASKVLMSQAPEMSLNQFSFQWAAPEVLENGSPSAQLQAASHGSDLSHAAQGELHRRVCSQSFMSDVYSFGIVVWEVLSREVPWAGLSGTEMRRRVCIVDKRPAMPPSAPPELADLARACWGQAPESRLTCDQILDRLDGSWAGPRTATLEVPEGK